MRQISLPDPARSRQTHILTTRRDLSAAEVRCWMGGRWRQKNHYRDARIHFDDDSHDWGHRPLAGDYRAVDDDPNRTVSNPARKPAYQQVEKARRALHSAETARDRELLAASTPPPGTTTVLTNQILDTMLLLADREALGVYAIQRGQRCRVESVESYLLTCTEILERMAMERMRPRCW
jgi:hypothetical protein